MDKAADTQLRKSLISPPLAAYVCVCVCVCVYMQQEIRETLSSVST